MASPYKYTRIDLATDAIRLVTLLRGEQSQPIECEIFETYLHQIEGVPYEALSYVWGIKESPDWISLDGCQFALTKNLHEALIHLRRPDEDRVLWVDAICIDQSHDAERGHQVGQMRAVYQTAQRVIIWLGPSYAHIDCLFDWMNDLDKQVLAIARPHEISTWENQWSWLVWELRGHPPPDEIKEALSDLLRRKWFSRIWVLQEAALARSAIIACGRNNVNSRVFVVMPSLLNVDCSEGEQARLDILPGLLRKRSWWAERSSKELFTLLQKFGRSEASDPRDIIYALLGLSGDAHSSELLRPNYEISVEETVQQSMAYFMLQMRCLSERTTIQLLPSWGIDEFLDKLHDLSFHVFKWAADHAEDDLLYDLILSQKENLLAYPSHPYMAYMGIHGPLITIAIKKANSALIGLILTLPGMDVVSVDSENRTPMLIAMNQGNIAVARSILEYRRQSFHEKDPNYGTLLLTAKQESTCTDLPMLLRENSPFAFSRRDLGGNSPLLVATKQGDQAAVESILSHPYVDLSIVDSNGDGVLNIAARRGDEHVIDLLLQHFESRQVFWSIDQDLRFRGSDGLTPFEMALVSNVPGIIKRLLYYSRDTVDHAVKAGHFEVLRVVLDVDSRLANSSFDLRKLLSIATQAGNTNVVSLLLDKGADINSKDLDSRAATPLWIAASCGHLDTVKLLVERGADIGLMANESPFKTTALWAAASRGHINLQVVMYLLKVGAHVGEPSGGVSMRHLKDCLGSETVLWAATCGGHTEAVRALAEGGVDLEVPGPLDFDQLNESPSDCIEKLARPIWIAASLGYADIVSLLIEHGVDFEARDTYYGMTPFLRAAQQNMSETMEVLMKYGANLLAKPGW